MRPTMSLIAAFLFLELLAIPTSNIGFCEGSSHMGCIKSERQALLRFKQDLNDSSSQLASWTGHGDCCTWAGVVCDNFTGHVLELHLGSPLDGGIWDGCLYDEGAKLRGKLNPSLLNLKRLIYLDLSCNNFEGIQIPKFLGSMKNLRYLNLSSSRFWGRIPQQLGNLSKLQYLDLHSDNSWKGLLFVENFYWLSSLSLLKHLDLSYVDLSKASDWLSVSNTLPSLIVLQLSNCELYHLPPLPNANFSSLASLDLSDNSLNNTLIPRWVFGLSHLIFLNLSDNHFGDSNLERLQNLTSLEYLSLSTNELQGAILDDLGNLTSIKILDLSSNSQLEGRVPRSWGNFCKLSSISLSHTNMSQEISEILDIFSGCVSKTLEYLDLSGCQISGSLTNEVGKFQNLKFLSLAQNSISGHIPSSLGEVSFLTHVGLSQNQLSGSIPLSIGNLSCLEYLDISSNNINGSIPPSLENLSSLIHLNVSSNSLSGSIPLSIGNLSHLEYLNLSSNNLRGSIPPSLGNLCSLIALDVSSNSLSGSIPSSLGKLSSLEDLDLSFNKMNGSLLPIHFVNLTRLFSFSASGNSLIMKVHHDWVPPFELQRLNLQSCHLGPHFPSWLISQNSLEHLDISNAGIADSIPSEFWESASQISTLDLSHNQIYGEIPDLIWFFQPYILDLSWNNLSCSSLKFLYNQYEGLLDLSNNLLSGTCLHHSMCNDSKSLRILNLENNFLSGELPDCWGNWSSLLVLKLNNNKFTGSIPPSFGSLSSLTSLQLRNNSFSGVIPVSLSNCTKLKILDISENEFVGNLPQWIGERFSSLSIFKQFSWPFA